MLPVLQSNEHEFNVHFDRDTIANRDSSITERDTNIMTLQRQADAVTDELKVNQTLRSLEHKNNFFGP